MNSSKLKQLFPDNGLQLRGIHELSAKLNCKNRIVCLQFVCLQIVSLQKVQGHILMSALTFSVS